jgi:hypothetical protein
MSVGSCCWLCRRRCFQGLVFFISISIDNGLGLSEDRELAAAKNNDRCFSTLSPTFDGCHKSGLPKILVCTTIRK